MNPVLMITRLFVTPNSVVRYAMNGGTSSSSPTSATRPPTGRAAGPRRSRIAGPTTRTTSAFANVIQWSVAR